MSLLCTGAARGFGRVTPVVSDTAETSIAEGGAIVSVWKQSQKCSRRVMLISSDSGVLFTLTSKGIAV